VQGVLLLPRLDVDDRGGPYTAVVLKVEVEAIAAKT
jgi:hypothetical protein